MDKAEKIHGLNITAGITLTGDKSLIRLILVTDDHQEYLVYEVYPLLVEKKSYAVRQVCEETCFLEAVAPLYLKVELIDASFHLDEIELNLEPVLDPDSIRTRQKEIKQAQDNAKIANLNKSIKKNKLKWTAGETGVSKLFYAQKRKLFGGDRVPNFQGFDFYVGGIFEHISGNATPVLENAGEPSFAEHFDWRSRHRSNYSGSPYFDGDHKGSGWISPIRNQGACGSCWAFSAVGATEALANIYFNRHLDLDLGFDLSEQDILSCSGAGSCNGGNPGQALSYIAAQGAVNESCFPYAASDEPCYLKCTQPSVKISINGRTPINPNDGEDSIKGKLIEHGPLNFGISSWWHSMVLAGYDRDPDDGKTVWFVKNSWGENWGEYGYGRIKVELSDLYLLYYLQQPLTIIGEAVDVSCRDEDRDGFYNWGISKTIPPTCPNGIPLTADGDDANPYLGPMDLFGYCARLPARLHVAAGDDHTVGLKSDYSAVSAGGNEFGQRNLSNWADIVNLSAGGGYTVGLKSDLTVLCEGDNSNGQCNVADWADIVQVAAGYWHAVGLVSNGRVLATGANWFGQLDVSGWSGIVQVAAGVAHTVGLKLDGSVVAVGYGSDGQLNVGAWDEIVQVAAGLGHTVGLKSDGSVVAVGSNADGQCNVSGWTGIVQVAAGSYHTLGLKSDGNVVAVGWNDYGQLNVSGWMEIVQIAAGHYHTAGLKPDGSVVAVGRNEAGQCDTSSWDLSVTCEGDFAPSDGDVDGSDLALYLIDNRGVSLAIFAGEFGRTGCP